MHQRIGMNQFNGTRRLLGRLIDTRAQAGRGKYQQGANPFAAVQARVAHGLVQTARHQRSTGYSAAERAFHALLDRAAPVLEVHLGAGALNSVVNTRRVRHRHHRRPAPETA